MMDVAAKERLRESILEIGFDVARFTNLEPLEDDRLQAWLEAGLHADMEWLKRSIEKRLNPNLVLEGACSAIMLGINYWPEDQRAREQNGFAKYSLYKDYHDTVLPGLKSIGRLLETEYGLGPRDYRYYVDTGPVMERGWAAASGLGWQGKNGMLISRDYGNWLLLATVLLKLEIEPDPPLTKGGGLSASGEARPELGLLCGKCTRCMDACPTGAIVEPGLLDARLCISYQTIENKGSIPRDLRGKIGSRIYGCDICLDVCPWNRFAKTGRQQLLEGRSEIASLSLLDLLQMDVETFRERFRKMPMKRTKLRGLKRNACIAAGNLHEAGEWWPREIDSEEERRAWLNTVVEALIELAMNDEEALVREHAVWATYRLIGDAAVERLRETRDAEADSTVLAEYAAWQRARTSSERV